MIKASLLLTLALVVLFPARGMAQWSLSSGFDYTSGDYGLSEDTRMLAIPFTATYAADQWTFRASLPYLRVSGPAYVVPELGGVGGLRPVTSTESGAGDLIFSAAYSLAMDAGQPGIDLSAKVKLGTADDAKGLGTGESDLYFQADVYHVYGDFAPFGTLGYRVLGDPATFDLEDGLFASAGISYRLSDPTRIGGVFDWRQRTVEGGDSAVEFTAFVTHRLNERWRVQVYAVKGFTDASPDVGVGSVVGYSF